MDINRFSSIKPGRRIGIWIEHFLGDNFKRRTNYDSLGKIQGARVGKRENNKPWFNSFWIDSEKEGEFIKYSARK